MKKAMMFLLLLITVTSADAQSLKDLLYSGKLKKDSNIVIRKGDDLSTRIDTGQKKPAEPEIAKNAGMAGDSSLRKTDALADSAMAAADITDSVVTVTGVEVASNNASAKNNNTMFKQYMDSLVSILKTDVLPSKKIKSETYYLYVDYEIGINGQVDVTKVVSSPENSFLQEQVKERLILDAPQLTPVLDSSNKPRKVKRKYNFNITKE